MYFASGLDLNHKQTVQEVSNQPSEEQSQFEKRQFKVNILDTALQGNLMSELFVTRSG